jgi:amidase
MSLQVASQLSTMPPLKRWQEIARERKLQQEKSIPNEWRIQKPAMSLHNVTSIPADCGILNQRELEITEEKNVGTLLEHLATRRWTALEVTTATLKRAAIAHQLVGINPYSRCY